MANGSVYAINNVFPDGDMLTQELTSKIRQLPLEKEIVLIDGLQTRLDLVSYQQYGTSDLWWLIAIYNEILDVTDTSLQILKLKLPSLADITELLTNYVRGLEQ